MEGSGDSIYSPLHGGLYKEEYNSLVPWLGTEQMPRLIASLGPKITMIGLFQEINIMKNSRTEEDLYIMVDSVYIP